MSSEVEENMWGANAGLLVFSFTVFYCSYVLRWKTLLEKSVMVGPPDDPYLLPVLYTFSARDLVATRSVPSREGSGKL